MISHPFLFLRHGETTWNRDGRAQGRLDIALNDQGRAQARAAAGALSGQTLSRIVASPLSRVRDTAEAVAAPHGLDVEYDAGLMECGLGEGEGQPRGPWLQDYWSGAATPAGGEPFVEFVARVWRSVARQVDRPDVLIVGHGGGWRAILEHVPVTPAFWMPNGVPVRVTPPPAGDGPHWRVEPLLPLPSELRPITP